MEQQPEIFVEGLDFGEGPRWHDGRLWVSDFYQQRVCSYGPTGDAVVELELDDQPSGLGWLPSGDLLVVAMTSRQVRRVDAGGAMHAHADLWAMATGHCNDMVVGPDGNAYVGNFGFDTDAPKPEAAPADLVLVRPDGTAVVAATQLGFPNGSVITPDGSTLIVGESMRARYTAFTICDDGTLADRHIWAEVPGTAPDGCALDAEGAVWMADARGGGCLRIAPDGAILDAVSASQPVFACALGGAERRTLHLITAPGFGERISKGKGLGRIESVPVDVPGAGWP
jgi:sugar lactone lactonase YvrE